MNLYSKKGMLFLVQADHLSGELIGSAIEAFFQAGAKNVQVIATVTKKNRAGHLIVIDGSEATAEAIERVIVEDCGSSGWHRIDTCHRHTDVAYLVKTIRVCLDTEQFNFTVRGKQIADDRGGIRPEYDSCVELQKELSERQKKISIRRIKRILERALVTDENTEIVLD